MDAYKSAMLSLTAGTRDKRKQAVRIIRAPFSYAGNKGVLVPILRRLLPQRRVYAELFGGSGTILLNKAPSEIDVFNDTHSGIVALYRCLRNPDLLERLNQWINLTVHSYEDWTTFKESWKDAADPVERAGRWLYVVNFSFSGLGRNFGFERNAPISGRLIEKTKLFQEIHKRLRNVTIENNDWAVLLERYDSSKTVFYLDPPYLDTQQNALSYGTTMGIDRHIEMLDMISTLQGFVALSGYANDLYDKQTFWSERIVVPVTGLGHKGVEEIIWIKN